ncbi:MAG: DUF2149 domain-containing protein [Prosthecobacter sp.]|nr:DUF2149 domain-containing protein [Prosthecobacter sp.]
MKRPRKIRKWDANHDDDPAAGLLNLFDVWIAFAAALLLAIVSYDSLSKQSTSSIQNEGTPEMEIIHQDGTKVEHFRASPQTLGGDGQRLGTAYRLKSGEVIYVPEKPEAAPAPQP